MFKLIPGNNEYVVSLSQEFRRTDGSVVDLPITNGKIDIELYGKIIKVCPKWVSLISHFEMHLPEPNVKSLMNVYFVNTSITFHRSISGKTPLFRLPVKFFHNEKEFRVIPAFNRYAVSADGVVIEISSRETLNVTLERKNNGVVICEYPSVYIYNPEKMSYKYLYVHRLVAMAWVKNPDDDYVNNPIVNHIDGDKNNYHCRNLEWCSFRENSLHAIEKNLRQDNIRCKIRDFRTGVVRHFPSLTQAGLCIGMTVSSMRLNKKPKRKGYLLKGIYEFKSEEDQTPWFYENKNEAVKNGRYMIEVKNQDGTIDYFHDTRDFQKKFKLWNCGSVKVMIEKAKANNLGVNFTLHDFYRSEPIQSYNTKTKEILETKTIAEMSTRTGIPQHLIKDSLSGNETWVKKGFAFRYKSQDDWNTDFINKGEPRGKGLKLTNKTSGEIKLFNSIREASRFFSMKDRYWIKKCAEQNKDFDGWKFEFVK